MVWDSGFTARIGYKLPTFQECMSVGGFLCALRAQGWGMCLVRNVHFLMCILVLDINCQHLGDVCQLEGFCAPFGRRVGEYVLSGTCPGGSCPWGNLSGGKLSGGNLSLLDACLPGELVRGEVVQRGTCPGGNCPKWNLSTGALVRGEVVRGEVVPGELVRGEVVRRGTCPGGSCPGGYCPQGHLSGGNLLAVYIQYKYTYKKMYIPDQTYSPNPRPKGAQKPPNQHTLPKCWQPTSNTSIHT